MAGGLRGLAGLLWGWLQPGAAPDVHVRPGGILWAEVERNRRQAQVEGRALWAEVERERRQAQVE